MQRKFLEDLGLEKDNIDKIMAENGADINKTKDGLNTQITELTEQLNTAKETLKSFEGVDVKDLQGKVSQLTTDLATKDTEYQQKMADRDFSDMLRTVITTAGGKNEKAVMALLDIDNLKVSKNQETDIKSAIEACQKENGYLFGTQEPIQNPTAPTTTPITGITKEMFTKMGYGERLELKKSDPNKYDELRGN